MSVQESADRSAQALYRAMIGASGPGATGWTGAMNLSAAQRQDQSVLVLGAGVGGLTAAYELSKLGYSCTVLEAQSRAGGRSRTARRGDKLYEVGSKGGTVHTHTCSFDEGLYLNLGPGRIPHHHRRVLKYCRELSVALEPYIMETTANLVRPPGDPSARWPNRRVANDTRGHIAALLASNLTGEDEFTYTLRDLLRVFGDLDSDGEYHGSTRSGYDEDLDIHDFPRPAPPLDFEDLVKSRFWEASFYQPVDRHWQPTLFQPVGGMDKLVEAFMRTLASEPLASIKLEAAVTSITLPDEGGVVVEYQHRGATHTQTADYCVSSIPLPVLQDIPLTNFSPEFLDAMNTVGFAPTCKVGWQANRRFWENDHNQIYGGISWTDHNITQMWYPSNDYFSAGGTLTGAYNFGEKARYLGDLAPEKRLEEAHKGAVELHPEFEDDRIVPRERGISIAWHKIPYQLGGWAAWDPADPSHMIAYKQLLQPEGEDRFYVLGDQASPLPGWQEGAMMSAHYVTGQILGIIPLTVSDVVQVPDSVALTQGLT